MDKPRVVKGREYRGADGHVVSPEEAERRAQADAEERARLDAKIKAGTKTETFQLPAPTAIPARAPIPPAKRKPKG